MKIALRDKYLSRSRFNRYLISTGNDLSRANRLYKANIRLGQAFYPLLSQFEVIFRNSLDQELSDHFSTTNWILSETSGFMNDNSLRPQLYLKKQVLRSQNNMNRNGITITSGKLLADQTLGFWVAFFSIPHYRLLQGKPIHIFSNKPGIENRSSLHQKLEKIRDFRNRVNHCEPICFVGNTIDCNLPLSIRNLIFDLSEWMNPDLISFLNGLDNIQAKVDNILRI